MRTAEIRTRWLDYFAKNDHVVVPSVSLVSPDPSILFTIAGMVPFIPYIMGTEPAPWPRATSVQKCIRTNDIDNVGRTTRHGTFFQMNGNFSFGDYFKEGAINFAWELLTMRQADGGYGLDGDRLWVTIWDEDAEALDALRRVGVDERHIVRLPREENFWDTGQPGPAGPCAEFHYDRGPEFGPEAEGGTVDPGGDRYLEVWNLVFDQYLRGEGQGKDYPLLGELEHKSIDTGAGLERLAFLLQGKNNMYEIDEVFPLIEATEAITSRRYGNNGEDDVRMRIIADHVRSALMLIGDGVRPGNDGRGYVLRRILRRAVRSVRLLGIDEPALPHLLPVAKDAMVGSYPELETAFPQISDVAYAEEEAFRRTLSAGSTILDTAVTKAKQEAAARGATTAQLSGAEAFTLHDTYGFPIDLTLEMAAEHGVTVDEKGFREHMAAQRERARADALAKKAGGVDPRLYQDLRSQLSAPTEFLGYTENTAEVRLAAMLVDGQPAPAATAPAEVELVLDRTPFYAEAGGQLPDHGTVSFAGGALVDINDVQSPLSGMSVHRGTLVEGTLTLDEPGVARIDVDRRRAIARAHTATHMVHKALHETLGDQATQAGSENAPSRLRLDFRHGSALPGSALGEIEERVNLLLAEDLDVSDAVMPLERAKELGAMALFGEKYGEEVRVVSIGEDWSRELCAGTHVPSTGHLGRVALLGESSIGSGVRRVDALVGEGAYRHQAQQQVIINQVTQMLGSRPEELPDRISSLMARLKAHEKELATLRQAQLLASADRLAASAERIGELYAVLHDAGTGVTADDARRLALDLRTRLGEAPAVVVVAAVAAERPVVVAATNPAARDLGVRAGDVVRTAAQVLGGGGGGKDDIAQGGGTEAQAVGAALQAVRDSLSDVVHR